MENSQHSNNISINKQHFTQSQARNVYRRCDGADKSTSETDVGFIINVDTQETVYFRDGERKIDFVLAYEAEKIAHMKLRQTFENNLLNVGLELELEPAKYSFNGKTCFLKVHAPWNVLTRYAEMTNLPMPMIENDLELGYRSKKFTKPKSGAADNESFFTFLQHNLQLMYIKLNRLIHDNDMDEPLTPYYMAPFNMNRLGQFLITDTRHFFHDIKRIFIVWEILRRTSFDDNLATGNVGIYKLLNMNVYTAAFPLHDGPVDVEPYDLSVDFNVIYNTRMKLFVNWANPNRWYKAQPLERIRYYLGDTVALYFSFLGFYTKMLIIPSIVGVLVFVFGLVTRNSYDTPSDEACNKIGDTVMCPTCDQLCDYWRLSGSCLFMRLTYIFDNYSTIVLAVITTAWANILMILWERKENTLRFQWDMENYEESEQVRPEFEVNAENFRVNPVTHKIEAYATTFFRLRKTFVSFSLVILLLIVACFTALGVITYRIAVTKFYAEMDKPLVNEYAKLIAAASGSLINLITISILDVIYFHLAQRLTSWENHRTETEHEHSLTVKLFLFQCVNYYSAIVYIALFKGKLIGRPGHYYRLFGLRSEECDVAGCFIEFSIMCITVMLGKQIFALFYELALYPYIISPLWKYMGSVDFSMKGMKRSASSIHRTLKSCTCDVKRIATYFTSWFDSEDRLRTRWEKDYMLEALPEYGLLYEYLELAIQYGFVTLFVVGFPLAPLIALINNVIEIQIDSYKVLVSRRRPYQVRTHGIGIWLKIFRTISRLSILVNGIILAWTSDIVNKFLYVIGHCDPEDIVSSPHLSHICQSMWDGLNVRNLLVFYNKPELALKGYIGYSLSKFDVRDWEAQSIPADNGTDVFSEEVRYCYYRDFRHPPESPAKYELTKEYWHVLAAKLAFVMCFEQAMLIITGIASVLISVKREDTEDQRKRAKFLANEAIQDLERERSRQNLSQKKKAALNRINYD